MGGNTHVVLTEILKVDECSLEHATDAVPRPFAVTGVEKVPNLLDKMNRNIFLNCEPSLVEYESDCARAAPLSPSCDASFDAILSL